MSGDSNEIDNLEVKAVFESYPEEIQTKLAFLRELILETAAAIKEVGEIEETLKWGEPSYLTPITKSGSTIRVAWKEAEPDQYAIYFKCTADLVPAFRERYPTEFKYGGDRSIVFDMADQIPVEPLRSCISLALTYHLNKKLEPAARWEMVEKLQDNHSRQS